MTQNQEVKKKLDIMWDDTPINVSKEVNLIWSIANKLRGPYRSDKYKDVIIPMTIIRRIECALEETKDDVVAQFEKNPSYPAKAMYRLSKYQFYNTSRFSLKKLVDDPEHIASNFKNYIEGFSTNIQDIIKSLEFDKQIEKMDLNDRLYSVVKSFSEIDLSPETIDNVKMGYVFEELIRKFSENAEAGDHYTGRDIVKLLVNIVMSEGCDDIFDDGKVITILDQAAGTGGMLSTAYNYIKRYNPTADVRLFGQEVNPESYAICKAEMLIKGQDAENIRYQDTMKDDAFKFTKMRFVLENPPFGQSWGGDNAAEGVEEEVRKEYLKGFNGRWGAGLPGTGDMQLLFVQSAINKLDDHYGRAAIIENGSPFFSGGTSSGESQIRKWLLEQDLIEAIISLPTDLFYNTNIGTYALIISKNKREERKGKVQLINGAPFCHKLKKSLGKKQYEITPEDRAEITKLYANFEENEFSKIYPNEEFMYREYTVKQPLQRSYMITEERIQNMLASGALKSIYDEAEIASLEEKLIAPEFTEDSKSKKTKSKEDIEKEEKKRAEKLEKWKKDLIKSEKKIEQLKAGQPLYERILEALNDNISDKKYLHPDEFTPVLTKILLPIVDDKKLLDKIADGLSEMDKEAIIQTDKKGNILYDDSTKDTELVPYLEDVDTYMIREVYPHVPDAKYFFEHNEDAKKPVLKIGAEINFSRYFYEYKAPEKSDDLLKQFMDIENSLNLKIKELEK